MVALVLLPVALLALILFDAIKNGTYRPEDHRVTADDFNPDYDDADIPF